MSQLYGSIQNEKWLATYNKWRQQQHHHFIRLPIQCTASPTHMITVTTLWSSCKALRRHPALSYAVPMWVPAYVPLTNQATPHMVTIVTNARTCHLITFTFRTLTNHIHHIVQSQFVQFIITLPTGDHSGNKRNK